MNEEQRLADLLAGYDELLASGSRPAEWRPDGALSAEARRRLEAARACLRLLEELHPRAPTVLGGPPPGPPADVFAPGALVGPYRVEGKLGSGGMGVVYRARDTRLARPVALKVLPQEYARDPQRLARFRHEARTASALNHPHICTVHDIGEYQGRPYIVMEFIEGRTLQSLVGSPLGAEALAQLVGQAARALAAAHAAGVVHRDVKPDNVMVRDDGFVKVLDFGLARGVPPAVAAAAGFRSPDTDPGTLLGTVHYMSPEQARSEPAEAPSDVFSLGIVLYELATGRHPFAEGATSPLAVLHAIATQDAVPASRGNPAVGPGLEGLLSAMLARDPALRPSASEVDATLSSLAGRRAPWPVRPARAREARPTVGRQRERAALRDAWARASAGEGMLVCVTGEPGLGKTTLVEGLLAEVEAAGPAILARGRCPDPLAGGEAYQPVLQALEGMARGPGGETVTRILRVVAPSWFAQVAPCGAAGASVEAPSQPRRQRELLALLEELGRRAPVLLFLDDLHWADVATAELLAYLGAHLGEPGGPSPAASTRGPLRLLVVLTYRPTELLLSGHTLRAAVLDLQTRGACREIPLGFLVAEDTEHYLGLAFPDHAFPTDFAGLVHGCTGGNPLFLVELLRYLKERGVAAQRNGRWALVQSLPDLRRDLPPSVRGMIQRKLEMLDEGDRALLAAASVQGQEFDSAVLARVLGRDAAEVEERLGVLDHVHGLVRLLREDEFPDRTLSLRYAFVHGLYQAALHAGMAPSRRAGRSAAMARALVELHGTRAPTAAAELARLFEAGREPGLAADHYRQAAENAARVSAHQEAAALARRGLVALRGLPDDPENAAREVRLQLMLGLQLQMTLGFAAPEVEHAYTRALQLCQGPRHAEAHFAAAWGLWLFSKVRSDLPAARERAARLLALAGASGDRGQMLQVRQALAVTSLCLGEPAETVRQMEAGLNLYDPLLHRGQTYQFGQDPGVACRSFGAVALWLLGWPDEAARRAAASIEHARSLGQPSTMALALHFAAMVHQCRREPGAVRALAGESLAIAAEQGFSFWHAGARVLLGWARAASGDITGGLADLRDGVAAWRATGSQTYLTYYFALLAEAHALAGDRGAALATLTEALDLADRTEERLYEAELHRLRGVLGGEVASLARAAEVARACQAAALELKALLSLAPTPGCHPEAVERLRALAEASPPVGDPADLEAARRALRALARPSAP